MPFDYKQNYDAELTQREHLRAAVGTPIGLLTLIGTGLAYMYQKFDYALDPAAVLFTPLVLSSTAAAIVSGWHLVHAMHGHTYK